MKIFTSLSLVVVLLGSGCRSIGPKKETRIRFDYSHSLADSCKNQMLLNIVKVGYLDLPVFLEVGQLISGYSLETIVTLGGTLSSVGGLGSLGTQGRYTDRPTITYMPLTGERFLKEFLTPIPPLNGFSLVQSAIVLFFRNENVAEEIQAKATEVRQLLKVEPDHLEFELVYSPMHGGRDKPKDCYVAVPFEDEWFWIANDDWKLKRTYSFILFLFTLTDAGGAESLPTIITY